MNKKSCPVCKSLHTVKNGKRNGTQTYKCADCGYQFRSNKLASDEQIWSQYLQNKQTIHELAATHKVSTSTIKRQLRNISIKWVQPELNCGGFVHLDATYWGRNSGIIVALDSQTNKVLYLSFIKHEKVADYEHAIESITRRNYEIRGIVIDGLKSLFIQFSSYKIQMCHFHMIQIVKRYITQNPRLLAARELQKLILGLSHTNRESFEKDYSNWKENHQATISKRSVLKNGKSRYRHRRLRSAMNSIDYYLPYLFTYQEPGCEGMPNTNNKLEGLFTDLKKNLNNHSGMREENRKRFICGFFLAWK